MKGLFLRARSSRAVARRNCLLLATCFGLTLCAAPALTRAQEPPARRSPTCPRWGRAGHRAAAGRRLTGFTELLSNRSLAESLTTTEAAVKGAAERPKTYEDPQMRLNWFLFQRTFPADTLPSKGRFNAFSEVSLLPSGQLSPQPTPPTKRWRYVGPSPIAPKFSSIEYRDETKDKPLADRLLKSLL